MGNHKKTLSFYLFSNPSFLSGIARLGDFGASYDVYNDCPTEQEADLRALKIDFAMVGNDMYEGVKKYEREFTTAK
jgi:hypothetical protein